MIVHLINTLKEKPYKMQAIQTAISDLLIIKPALFSDARGFFFESFNQRNFEQLTGHTNNFWQDNHSRSTQSVLRGLHYQIKQPQGKLVRVVHGEVFDVAVDIRKSSPTFGRWVSAILSAENKQMLWIPEGFAHGFVVLSEYAELLYKTTDYWAPEYERSILWNDPYLAINWPLKEVPPILSKKDREGTPFYQAEFFS